MKKMMMNKISNCKFKQPFSTLWTYKCWFIILIMLSLLTSCVKFKRYDPSPIGTYYPNQSIRVTCTKDDWNNSEHTITLSGPVEIKAVGKMTWNSLMGNYQETALIQGDYFLTTSFLQANGRIEYTENKTSAQYFWESNWGSFIKLIIFGIGVFIVVRVIIYIVKKNKERKREIEKRQREEAERLRQEEFEREERRKQQEQERIEREIERRKNIVLDIANNLYKETEKEVNKTLIPTMINELYDIYTGLHSENMNDLIINGSDTNFQNIINSVVTELNRLKKLAIEAQKRGYTDEENEYSHYDEGNGEMTKEKAFEILGLKINASKEDIKKAYRDLVKKYNTDQRTRYEDHVKQMLEDKMKEINRAKDYLTKIGII